MQLTSTSAAIGAANTLSFGDDGSIAAENTDAISEYATVVDLVYRAGGTALIEEAERRGASTVDGLEILVRQGALSFSIWTGRPAPLDAMRAAARAARPGLEGNVG